MHKYINNFIYVISNATGRNLSCPFINSNWYYYMLQSDIYISTEYAITNFLEEKRRLMNHLQTCIIPFLIFSLISHKVIIP